jgi:hypothetical protein
MKMGRPWNFIIANLTKEKETFSSIFQKVKVVNGEKAMTASQIYKIIKPVKEEKSAEDKRKQNLKKRREQPMFWLLSSPP